MEPYKMKKSFYVKRQKKNLLGHFNFLQLVGSEIIVVMFFVELLLQVTDKTIDDHLAVQGIIRAYQASL